VSEQCDVVVVGLGPGGEDLAGRLAEAGLSVVGIDGNLVGGECPYWGCVPSKMMIRAANLLAEGRRIPGIAGSSTVRPDWAQVAQRIRDEATDTWDDQVAVDRLESKGAQFVRGWATIEGPNRVVVNGRTFQPTRALVIASGDQAWMPPIDGLKDSKPWSNRDAVETEEVPKSLLVLGGGAIGVELGQVFSRFGANVTIVEVGDRLLAPEDRESSELMHEVLEREGLAIVLNANVTSVENPNGRFTIHLNDREDVTGDQLLVATGRRPDLVALGVASLGLDETARSIPVDERLRVAPGVWAIGDVTGEGAFTHVSMYQARIATADILGTETDVADYRALPRVTFSDPEIGSVGLGQAAAEHAGLRLRVGLAPIAESTRGWIHKSGNDGFIKLIEDADRGVLVGATSAGPVGGEVLGLLTLAVHAEVPTAKLRSMIYAYPTFHRTVEAALLNMKEVDPKAS
jgi:pyruvate/2-oxoglutarate dehydrogenase complex dihydrolipoamide dehydrogenase (E3) component